MRIFFVFIFSISINSYSGEDLRRIKLGHIQASERINAYTKKFIGKLNKILKEKKYVVDAVPLPSVRDLIRSNEGVIHGALSRSNLVDNSAYPNLKMIGTPVAVMKYQLNKKKDKKLKDVKRKLHLVCIRDDRLCKGMLGKEFKVIEVNFHKAQSSMLKADRADLVMRVHIQATGLKEKLVVPRLKGIELEGYNEPFIVGTYTYINHKKYPEVYKALSEAYKTLKSEE